MVSTGRCYSRLVRGYDCAVGVGHQCVGKWVAVSNELVGVCMSLAKANTGREHHRQQCELPAHHGFGALQAL